ncbi:hypothetical protein G9A89_016373 [Geosiphon pyriformis]|nr:hypothetical protein G9A89_016373 [Geosiphon pyriformis]
MKDVLTLCLEDYPHHDWPQIIEKRLRPFFPSRDPKSTPKCALEQAFREKMFEASINNIKTKKMHQITLLLELALFCTETVLLDPQDWESHQEQKYALDINKSLRLYRKPNEKISLSQVHAEISSLKLPHTLFEDLLETLQLDDCVELFEFMEKQKARMHKLLLADQGRSLIIIRFVNELLRRADKARHLQFSAQISLYCSNVFALDERSAVNLNADCDAANVTPFEVKYRDQNSTLYETLWNLQDYFRNPLSAPSEEQIKKVLTDIQYVLDHFARIPLKNSSGLTATSLKTIKENQKIKKGDSIPVDFAHISNVFYRKEDLVNGSSILSKKRKNRTEEETFVSGTSSPSKKLKHQEYIGSHIQEEPRVDNIEFWPKSLTNQVLFDYQVTDNSFRSIILIQSLIILDFMSRFSAKQLPREAPKDTKEEFKQILEEGSAESEKEIAIKEPRIKQKRLFIPPGNPPKLFLSAQQGETVLEIMSQVKEQLLKTLPNGQVGMNSVLRILNSEKSWNVWKFMDKCQDIGLFREVYSRGPLAKRAPLMGKRGLPRVPAPMGSNQLRNLWKLKNSHEYAEAARCYHIDVEEEFADMEGTFTSSDWNSVECQMKRWHLWRYAAQSELSHFSKIKTFGKEEETKDFLQAINPKKYENTTAEENFTQGEGTQK